MSKSYIVSNQYVVHRYVPRDRGIVHAVLWTGKASCLVGFPDFNQVVLAIKDIRVSNGYLHLAATGVQNADVEEIAPHRFYIVVTTLGKLEVWPKDFFEKHYEATPEGATEEPAEERL